MGGDWYEKGLGDCMRGPGDTLGGRVLGLVPETLGLPRDFGGVGSAASDKV